MAKSHAPPCAFCALHRTWLLGLMSLIFLQLEVVQAAGARAAVHGGEVQRARRKSKSPLIQAVVVTEPGLDTQEYSFEEPMPLAADSVEVEVLACTLGHTDTQQLRGDWGTCLMPLVPGREAVGVVVAVGRKVKSVQLGQRVGVLLGSGMDSENDEEGADRGALDFMTIGAAAERLRVPAAWAFPLPVSIPSPHACGLLSCGGPIWSQLTRRKLPRGAKVAIVGGGTAGFVAAHIASGLGFETFTMNAARLDADRGVDVDEKKLPAGVEDALDAENPEHLRLHGGSIDALLCVTACDELDLTPLLPFLRRGGSVLFANAVARSIVLSPRLLQERRVSLLPAEPLSGKEVLALLSFSAQHRLRLQHQETNELSAANAASALRAIAAQPESRAVLMRSAQQKRWLKASKEARKLGAAPGSATSISSMLGIFSKVADESKRAAYAMREGLAQQTTKLVEQVEREQQESAAAKHGKLELPTLTAAEAVEEVKVDSEEEDDETEVGDDDDDDDVRDDDDDEEEEEDGEADDLDEDDDGEDDEGDDEDGDEDDEDDDDDVGDEDDEEEDGEDEKEDEEDIDDEDDGK